MIERFVIAGVRADRIAFERCTFTFETPGTPSAFLADFREFYGPTMNAYAAAAANGREAELHAGAGCAVQRVEREPAADVTSIPATYLRVTVTP